MAKKKVEVSWVSVESLNLMRWLTGSQWRCCWYTKDIRHEGTKLNANFQFQLHQISQTSRIHRCPCLLRNSVNDGPATPLSADFSQLTAAYNKHNTAIIPLCIEYRDAFVKFLHKLRHNATFSELTVTAKYWQTLHYGYHTTAVGSLIIAWHVTYSVWPDLTCGLPKFIRPSIL